MILSCVFVPIIMARGNANKKGSARGPVTQVLPVPILVKDERYVYFRVDIQKWCASTRVKPCERATLIYFNLPDRVQDASRHIPTEQLRGPNGVDILLKELDSVYLPATSYRKQQAFQKVMRIRRSPEVSVMEFLPVFKTAYHDMKDLGVTLPDDAVALCLLDACDLSTEAERHVVAAVPGKPEAMSYTNMHDTLHKIYSTTPTGSSDATQGDGQSGSQGVTGDVIFYSGGSGGRGNYRGGGRNNRRRSRGRGGFKNFSASPSRNNPYVRSTGAVTPSYRQTNPVGADGKISQCTVCDSRMHWYAACPHAHENARGGSSGNGDPARRQFGSESKSDNPSYVVAGDDRPRYLDLHPDLMETKFTMFVGCTSASTPQNNSLDVLLAEANGFAILDSGCTTNVCGLAWLNRYIGFLDNSFKRFVSYQPSNQTFTFGGGTTFVSKRKVTFPCWVGGQKGTLTTDIIGSNIPLLLSRKAMKSIGMVLDFRKDEATVHDRIIKLKVTKTGHYALPITL